MNEYRSRIQQLQADLTSLYVSNSSNRLIQHIQLIIFYYFYPFLSSHISLYILFTFRQKQQQDREHHLSERAQRVKALETTLHEQLNLLSSGDDAALAQAVTSQHSLQLELDTVRAELRAARADAASQRAHVEEGKTLAMTLQTQLETAQANATQTLQEVRSQLELATAEKTALAKQASSFEEERATFANQKEHFVQTLAEVQEELREMTQKVCTLQEELQKKDEQMKGVLSKVSELEQQCLQKEKMMNEKDNALETAKRELEMAENERAKAVEEASLCRQQYFVGDEGVHLVLHRSNR